MAIKVVSSSELMWVEQKTGELFGNKRKSFTKAAGGEKLGCSIYEIEPGRSAFPKHFHTANEEAIYILDGEGTLHLGEASVIVKSGDYISIPTGAAHAHRLENTSAMPLRYLCFSTMIHPEVTMYVDSNKVGVMVGSAPGGDKTARVFEGVFTAESRVDYFFREKT